MREAGPDATDPPRHRRNFGLDVLRCMAIAIVLANHAYLGFFVDLGSIPYAGWRQAASLAAFVSIEWLFVLSGFLIGTMMIRTFEGGEGFWRSTRSFWLRRWFRTLPNYYLFLGVNAALVVWDLHGRFPAGEPRWRFVVFAQNLAWPERWPFFFNEAWSLALDEWFYLALPLLAGLAFVLARASVRDAVLAATAILILVPTTLRFLVPVPEDPFVWDLAVRRVTLLHLDATGWGVLAAALNRWAPGFWSRAPAARAIVGAGMMVVGVLSIQAMFGVAPVLGDVLAAWPRLPVAFALTLTGCGTFLALPWIASLPAPRGGVLQAGVERVSNYTYSIYLSHFPLLYVIGEVLDPSGDGPDIASRVLWVAAVVWLALVLLVSAGVHHAFEKPASDLRERFTRKVDASPFGPAPPP